VFHGEAEWFEEQGSKRYKKDEKKQAAVHD
jgi:hypothetical protein